MGLESSLERSETAWGRHVWWQTVPSSCCGDGECSVADRTTNAGTWRTIAVMTDLFHAMLYRVWYCYGKSSVHMSVTSRLIDWSSKV